MSERTEYDWYNEQGRVATQCEVSDKPTYSQLLGPNGQPLAYQQPPRCGFDLTPKRKS